MEKAQIESKEDSSSASATLRKSEPMLLIEAQAPAEATDIGAILTPELLKKMEMDARMKWGWITVYTGEAIVNIPQGTE